MEVVAIESTTAMAGLSSGSLAADKVVAVDWGIGFMLVLEDLEVG